MGHSLVVDGRTPRLMPTTCYAPAGVSDAAREKGTHTFLEKVCAPLYPTSYVRVIRGYLCSSVVPLLFFLAPWRLILVVVSPPRRSLTPAPLPSGEGRLESARGGRSRFQAFCAWMRPRSGMQRRNCPRAYVRLHGHIPGNRGPCSTLRRTFSSWEKGMG